MDRKEIAIYAIIVLVALPIMYVGSGLGQARAPSEYTGYVVDVEEDRGPPFFRTTQVHMKTHPQSSTTETFCVTGNTAGTLNQAYESMQNQTRATVAYERPWYVSPRECESGTSIAQNISLGGS